MNTTNSQMQDTITFIKSVLTPEQITFHQAVSVCSVVIEMGMYRASLEDVVDGLYDRFQGNIERNQIQEVSKDAINFGVSCGLMELVDSETFSLSSSGMLFGKSCLMQMQKAA